jgi:Cft2 family RNA processing exonuclease
MDKIETINFHEEKDVFGVKFWAYNAGHVLGAAMFMIEIAGVKVYIFFAKYFEVAVMSEVVSNCFTKYHVIYLL